MHSMKNEEHVSQESRRNRLALKAVGIVVGCVVTLCLFLWRSDTAYGAHVNTLTNLEDAPDSMSGVPGVDALDRAYNLFRGKYFDPQNSRVIGSFSYPSSPAPGDIFQVGSRSYVVPSLVDFVRNYQCQLRGQTHDLFKTASTYDMKSEGDSLSAGYDSTTTVSASVPVGPVEVGASRDIRTALLFGNSNSMSESNTYVTQSYSYRERAMYEASVYRATVQWASSSLSSRFTFSTDFVTRFRAVGSYSSVYDRNKKVMKFFNDFGSHVVDTAKFGARCSRSAFYKAGYNSESHTKASETSSGISGEFLGFQWGSTSHTATESGTSSATGVSYKYTAVQCEGIVENNACNQAQSSVSLQPRIMQALPKPIWDLQISGASTSVRTAFVQTVESLVSSGNSCRNSRCQGKGVCRRLSNTFWDKVRFGTWDGAFRTSDFDAECVCSSGVAPDCRPEPKTCAGYQLVSPSQSCTKKGYALATTNSQTCRNIGGASNGGFTDCHFNLCTRTNGNSAHGYGLGSQSDCSGDSSASYYLIVTTTMRECSNAGGGYNGSPSAGDWIHCHFHVCKKGRYYPAAVGSCPSNQQKKFYGFVSATTGDCNNMGGRWNGNPGWSDWISCHLDFCDAKCA